MENNFSSNVQPLSIEALILSGALEVAGIDVETGEPVFNFTNKLEGLYPELHKEVSTFITQSLMLLWELGFVEMDVASENPAVKLTDKALSAEEVSKLTKDQQYHLREIMRILTTEQ